tara:strand:+ start:129 stop:974 length:846 start_codon:yes stop_codon:yes gene_type:complete
MNNTICLLVVLSFISCTENGKANYEGIKLSKVIDEGIKNPECVFYDKDTESLFVSNVNGGTLELNGKGYISQMSMYGETLNAKLDVHLDAPKGVYVNNGLIYIADINRIVIHDMLNNEADRVIVLNDAKSLNDIVVDDSGRIFVSDFHANILFVVSEESISALNIQSPNGLYIYENHLYVGTFQEETNGHIYRINLSEKDMVCESFLQGFGSCDGLYIDSEIIVMSDYNTSLKVIDKEEMEIIATVVGGEGRSYGDFHYSSLGIVSPSMKSSQIHFLEVSD